jgi:hypothetical protein
MTRENAVGLVAHAARLVPCGVGDRAIRRGGITAQEGLKAQLVSVAPVEPLRAPDQRHFPAVCERQAGPSRSGLRGRLRASHCGGLRAGDVCGRDGGCASTRGGSCLTRLGDCSRLDRPGSAGGERNQAQRRLAEDDACGLIRVPQDLP